MPEKFVYDGVEYKLPTPKGLIFQSQASNYQLVCRDEKPEYDHGVRIGTIRTLVAEFGNPNVAQQFDDSTGDYYVPTQGHYCHTLVQAEQKGWDADERALVEKRLLVEQRPGLHWLHTAPPAGKPWPKYDTTEAGKIAEMAAALGLVYEAIAYESENKNRRAVVEALAAIPDEPEEIEAEELAAA